MIVTKDLQLAKKTLLNGGIIAYPTEGVWGLGCDKDNLAALERLLKLKQRDPAKGFILLVNSLKMMAQISLFSARKLSALIKQRGVTSPVTWLVPAKLSHLNALVLGSHKMLAVRLTKHKLARRLIKALNKPLVSTSANLAGQPPVSNLKALDSKLIKGLDLILEGKTGGLLKPTPIYNLITGEKLRD